jgi:hypothetical protein
VTAAETVADAATSNYVARATSIVGTATIAQQQQILHLPSLALVHVGQSTSDSSEHSTSTYHVWCRQRSSNECRIIVVRVTAVCVDFQTHHTTALSSSTTTATAAALTVCLSA